MTTKCEGCGNRTTAMGLCRTCKSQNHHATKRIEAEGLLLDTAGGAWWIWSPRGEVLVIGRATRLQAKLALVQS